MIKVAVSGLKELATKARKMNDKFILLELKQANVDVADIVVRRGIAKATATGRKASIRSAESMRVTKTTGYAAIRIGRKDKPWLIANNFGAKHDLPRTRRLRGRTVTTKGWNQFPKVGEKEFLYSTIKSSGDAIETIYGEHLQQMINREL